MSNVLSEEKKQQVIALGRLGWTLRRIQQATGVRRETASAYLKAAGPAATRRQLGAASARKTGQRGDHRLWPAALQRSPGGAARRPHSESNRQCLRALPGDH